MHKSLLTALLLLIASAITCSAATQSKKVRKTLFVIIDGIPADCLERLELPTLTDIAAHGAYSHAHCGGEVATYSETPTISAIGYTNILTGTWMNKHNVRGNENIHANYNYPTIFRIAKSQERRVTTAIYSSWTDNRTILLGEGLPQTGNLGIDFVRDGYDHDEARFPKKPGDTHIQDIDRQICQDAAACIAANAPDLNWLYLWYPDDAFHYNGNGDIADKAVIEADRMLAQVWHAVKEREKSHGEEWLVIVTTDPGRENNGYNHGGQSARERRTWMSVSCDRKLLNGEFSPTLLAQVDIVPTICRFMDFSMPQSTAVEMDGIPFIGSADIHNLQALKYDDKAMLCWDVFSTVKHPRDIKADIYYATTNNIKEGGKDVWHKLTTVSIADGRHLVDLPQLGGSKFYKFAVVSPSATLTKWFYAQ